MTSPGDGSDAQRATTPRPAGWLVPAGRFAGVPLFVSPAWFLVAALFTVAVAPQLRQYASMTPTVSYVVAGAIVLLVYASVLIHEASHVLVAKALGMRVGRVVLQLLGGVSEILDEPATADHEYLVAAVGPLTSVLLVGVTAALLPLFGDHSVGRLLVYSVLGSNAVIALFNLLPGLPLDGGRVARALIWQLTKDKTHATFVAGWLGRVIALGLVAVGLLDPTRLVGAGGLGTIYLYLIALFMWTNATASINQARLGSVLPQLDTGTLLRKAMPVDAQLPVAEAVRRAHLAGARALVVVDGRGKPQGLVSEAAVMQLPEQRRPWVSVSDLSRPLRRELILQDNITGETLLNVLRNTPASEYLVVAKTGAIRGVLAAADIGSALRAAGVR